MSLLEQKTKWETVEDLENSFTIRLKVDGGYLYCLTLTHAMSICFVPDVDLTRYESHLRDAYKKGFEDGMLEQKMNPTA